MNPLAAHNENKLLEYAYGELSGSEAKSLEAHLQSCPECTQALGSIQKVRRTMSQLPPASAPSAGLDSLIAYARQSARRAQSKAPARWSRLWLPGAAASVAALGLVVVVSSRVHKVADLSRPALIAPTEPEPRQADAPTVEQLKGNDEEIGLAEVAKKRATGPTPHRRVPFKEMDGRESRDEAESKGVGAGALGGVPSAPAEPTARGDQSPKASIAVGEMYGRAREKSAPPGASQAAGSIPRASPVNAAAPDRPNEIEGIRRTLSSKDLSGTQRAALLNRLCALLYEAGRRSEADSTCDAVIRQFPTTDFATSARRLKAQYAPARPTPEK